VKSSPGIEKLMKVHLEPMKEDGDEALKIVDTYVNIKSSQFRVNSINSL
jgi:hypothetical protein